MVDELETAKGVSSDNGGDRPFSPEQQEKVQGLIDDAYKRAYSKALRGGGVSDEVKKLKGEVESLKVERKNSALLKSVARHNVVDPEEVSELLNSRISFDDNGNLVAPPSASGTRVGVDEFVQSWLSERPHHLRSSSSVGSGSPGRLTAAGAGKVKYNLSDPESWRNMPREDFDRLMKEGVNISGGGSSKNLSFKNVSNPFHEARQRKFKS